MTLDPELPQVACFDTAFHRTAPEKEQAFALPYALYEEGVRRYGFHGPAHPEGLDWAKDCRRPQTEGHWRSHQVPFGDMEKPEHVKLLEEWMRSYRPQELFDGEGRLRPEIAALAPQVSGAWAPIPMPMAVYCGVNSRCLISPITLSRSPIQVASTPRRRGSWAGFCATSCATS